MYSPLKSASPTAWVEVVLTRFDEFLLDHANNEKKAAAVAMSLSAHYLDKVVLLETMADLALEELNHYRQVLKLLLQRGLTPGPDEKDLYVNQMLKHMHHGSEGYFLDRLLTAALIEARGAERFALLADALTDPSLSKFYQNLASSEVNHFERYLALAKTYFAEVNIESRWQRWLRLETEIMQALPIRPRLH